MLARRPPLAHAAPLLGRPRAGHRARLGPTGGGGFHTAARVKPVRRLTGEPALLRPRRFGARLWRGGPLHLARLRGRGHGPLHLTRLWHGRDGALGGPGPVRRLPSRLARDVRGRATLHRRLRRALGLWRPLALRCRLDLWRRWDLRPAPGLRSARHLPSPLRLRAPRRVRCLLRIRHPLGLGSASALLPRRILTTGCGRRAGRTLLALEAWRPRRPCTLETALAERRAGVTHLAGLRRRHDAGRRPAAFRLARQRPGDRRSRRDHATLQDVLGWTDAASARRQRSSRDRPDVHRARARLELAVST
jgi:hypothetical protein